MRAWCLTLLILFLATAGCQSLHERSAKEKSFEALSAADRAAVDRAVKAGVERCVTIRPAFMTIGSGCIVTADGWILTAEHVVRGRRTVDVELPSGASLEGRVIATSAGNDFALVKVDGHDLPYFQLGPRPRLGDRVVAVGTATKWVTPNASTGVVIYPQVRIPGEEGTYYYDAIFHSAPIFPGDSGGPLVDLSGDLVGIHGGFASESASVAPACAEIMRVLPG
ncbi:MAG TPA: S1C family serine protease, partial [Planctomycetota bacterium]|nr:S1C family serine protease [Planctomycetota bacterium]